MLRLIKLICLILFFLPSYVHAEECTKNKILEFYSDIIKSSWKFSTKIEDTENVEEPITSNIFIEDTDPFRTRIDFSFCRSVYCTNGVAIKEKKKTSIILWVNYFFPTSSTQFNSNGNSFLIIEDKNYCHFSLKIDEKTKQEIKILPYAVEDIENIINSIYEDYKKQ